MKSTITIAVKNPCNENFTNFSKTNNGGFCMSCEKEVIDFTKFSDEELLGFLSSTNKKTCGKFKTSQLKSYESNFIDTMNKSILTKGISIMSLSLLALCATEVKGQETASLESPVEVVSIHHQDILGKAIVLQEKYTLTGTIVDETNEPLPGVNVVLKGTAIGTQTDLDGKFEFPQQLEANDLLVFSYIGYETKTYKVEASGNTNIDIRISFDSYDVELMGDIEIGGSFESKRTLFQKFISIFR
tara:strand:- start:3371 stop:4102 length:732 start_codon:yes stop_codon:yes gene_type:complete